MSLLKGEEQCSNKNISFGKILFDGLKRHGDRICVIEEELGIQFTYQEILERTVKLSVAMRNLGFRRNDVIAIISENCVEIFVVLIACLYNGYITTLLSPYYTQYEYIHYLTQTEPKHIFCSETVLEKVEAICSHCKSIQTKILINSNLATNVADIIKQTVVDVNSFEPETFDPDEQIAFIFYSSGSTGLPKGVILTHRNISISLIQSGPMFLGANENEVYLYNLPLFHVTCIFPLSACFYHGCKLILFSKFNPSTFFTTIEKYKVSILTLVPQLVLFMIKSELGENANLSSIKQVYCGTAPISKETISLFRKKWPFCSFHQMYGLTETTAAVVLSPQEDTTKYSLGVVISGNEAKVVDIETRKPVGPNVLGEICFKGISVTKGYFRNEEATKKSFDEDGFLKTGDIGYYDEEGYIFAADRIKDVIKYKGYQVSSTEIESVLIMMEAVREVGVIGVEVEKVGEVPFAFIVCRENFQLTKEEVHKHIADHLSANKYLRGGIEFISNLPKTPMGKTDKKALRILHKEFQEKGKQMNT